VEVSPGEDVFISFSFDDMKPALAIAAAFQAAKIRFWLAPLAEGIGDDFVEDIEQALFRAKVVVLLASPSSARSTWVKREIALASNSRVTLMAVKLARFEMPPGWQLSLSTTIWVDATIRPLDEVVSGLVTQVRKKLGDVAAPRRAPLRRCPVRRPLPHRRCCGASTPTFAFDTSTSTWSGPWTAPSGCRSGPSR
jgi:hypothetical protein